MIKGYGEFIYALITSNLSALARLMPTAAIAGAWYVSLRGAGHSLLPHCFRCVPDRLFGMAP